MPDVTVPSTPSSTPPTNPSATQVLSVRVLISSSGGGVPAFNQGQYHDLLPVQDAGGQRTIQTSGCGLCAWACALAAAGCKAPALDSSTKKFSQGSATINPSNLLQYFNDYALSQNTTPAAAKTWAQQNIYAASNNGVLRNESSTVQAAVNQLLAVNFPNTTPAFDNTNSSTGGATGTDVAAITAALQAGSPVILAVRFTDSSQSADHQVLAVGMTKILDKTYYIINDSGFGTTDPLPQLRQSGAPVDKNVLGGCTASTKRNPADKDHSAAWGYDNIFRYRVLGGLQEYTNLTLKAPPF